MCLRVRTIYPDGRTVMYKSICHEQLMADAPAAPPTRPSQMKRLVEAVRRKIGKSKAKNNANGIFPPHYTKNIFQVSVDSFISSDLATYAHAMLAEDCGCEACVYSGGEY